MSEGEKKKEQSLRLTTDTDGKTAELKGPVAGLAIICFLSFWVLLGFWLGRVTL